MWKKMMMRILFRSVLFLSILFRAQVIFLEAQEVPASRSIDESLWQELKAEHPYDIAPPEPEGAFDRLWKRFTSWLWSLWSSETTGDVIEFLLYVLALIVFIYVAIKLAKVEVSTVFKPAQKNASLEVSEEKLDEIDFEAAIAQAKSDQNWRFLIRLLYLQALKVLWEREVVSVKKGKTNQEYLYELSNRPGAKPFEKLCRLFDYTWYGHFEANEVHAEHAEQYATELTRLKGGQDAD